MPKLSLMVSKLQVDGKTFNNPEWWSSKHKLTKKVKKAQIVESIAKDYVKGKLRSVCYRLNSAEEERVDAYVRQMSTLLDYPQYTEYAPWSPVFRKYTTLPIIIK